MAPSRGKRNAQKVHALSHGRAPIVKTPLVQSSRRTRNIIRVHHQLQKVRAAALAKGDENLAAEVEVQIDKNGGLGEYQRASIAGQSVSRGGDSSKLLVQWCKDIGLKTMTKQGYRPRLLEIGALSIDNACSKSNLFEVTRIDLRSQAKGILQQDFMQRPLPNNDEDTFDIISLSLVLNYVPEPVGRGEMLKRTRTFLRNVSGEGLREKAGPQPAYNVNADMLPLLFLVLPAPCVMNSRYLDLHSLGKIMGNLGFAKIKEKLSSKLAYTLWHWTGRSMSTITFGKREVNPGRGRNNFTITLE